MIMHLSGRATRSLLKRPDYKHPRYLLALPLDCSTVALTTHQKIYPSENWFVCLFLFWAIQIYIYIIIIAPLVNGTIKGITRVPPGHNVDVIYVNNDFAGEFYIFPVLYLWLSSRCLTSVIVRELVFSILTLATNFYCLYLAFQQLATSVLPIW